MQRSLSITQRREPKTKAPRSEQCDVPERRWETPTEYGVQPCINSKNKDEKVKPASTSVVFYQKGTTCED